MDTDYLFCIFKLILKKAKTCNTGILTKTGLDTLLTVVCRRAHVLFTLFVFVCVVHSGFFGGGGGVALFPLYCQFLWIVLFYHCPLGIL
jgi:hypothetical protein